MRIQSLGKETSQARISKVENTNVEMVLEKIRHSDEQNFLFLLNRGDISSLIVAPICFPDYSTKKSVFLSVKVKSCTSGYLQCFVKLS